MTSRPFSRTATRQDIVITVITSSYIRLRLPPASSGPDVVLARLIECFHQDQAPKPVVRPDQAQSQLLNIYHCRIFTLNKPSALGAIYVWSVSTIKRANLQPNLVASLSGRQTEGHQLSPGWTYGHQLLGGHRDTISWSWTDRGTPSPGHKLPWCTGKVHSRVKGGTFILLENLCQNMKILSISDYVIWFLMF